jgi:hypothetical protein
VDQPGRDSREKRLEPQALLEHGSRPPARRAPVRASQAHVVIYAD